MKQCASLATLTEGERRDFCRRVLDSLSDLVDGTASPGWQQRVATLLGGSHDFRALCDTLKEVVTLSRECGDEAIAAIDDAALERAVRRARERLSKERADDP